MRFTETKLADVWLVDLERRDDERGFFARSWCREEFASRGLAAQLAQCSFSYNTYAHTLRGMHYQAAPHAETKLVTCVRGAIYDVILDLRPSSMTYKSWVAVELTQTSLRAVYVPDGCAHGFQTLTEGALVYYQISVPHSPDHARGVRWNDPAFDIAWPPGDRIVSARDSAYPDFGG